ncbi:AIM24 family protein [Thermodesulfobacteriota bacterium]
MKFNCKHCGFSKDVPEQYAGKTVKCPQCKKSVKIQEVVQAGASRYSLAEFVSKTSQKDKGEGLFELESNNLLEINLNGLVWTKMGSMVAYRGDIKFTREGVLEHGVGKLFKKAVSGEGTSLTKAEGRGTLYLADMGKKISIIYLDGESISVNGNDLLAFESGIQWDINMLKKVAGMLSGGLFNVTLQGKGMIAITTHHDPLTLKVSPTRPAVTDPNATVAWSGNLTPEIKTDVSLKTFFGRGSGESIQMRFDGNGFVVVQPYEEVYFQGG